MFHTPMQTLSPCCLKYYTNFVSFYKSLNGLYDGAGGEKKDRSESERNIFRNQAITMGKNGA